MVAQDKRPAKKEKKEKGKGKEVTVIPSTVVQEGEEEEVAVGASSLRGGSRGS